MIGTSLQRLSSLRGPDGVFERSSLSGRMALWVMLMLLAYLVLYHTR
jgi:hypothetical protein